ncbi:hypothetical protein KBD18_01360 [Patescibacteria group bacterium]|nr:hypothetical protein [Patescibacteria group bacterium]
MQPKTERLLLKIALGISLFPSLTALFWIGKTIIEAGLFSHLLNFIVLFIVSSFPLSVSALLVGILTNRPKWKWISIAILVVDYCIVAGLLSSDFWLKIHFYN